MTGRIPSIARSIALGLLPLLVMAADPNRPTPTFAGKLIPDPPHQHDPWMPRETKLPRFLVRATEALSEAGLADPRGGEYREVEVGDDILVKTHGFVLPERPGDAGRFVVGWDGIVYPAFSVGEPADLEADVRMNAETLRKRRQDSPGTGRFGQAGGFVSGGRFGGMFLSGSGPVGVDSQSPLKVCLLLRLGRSDLAESLFAAGTTWTPDGPRPDLTDYHINFVTLANDWSSRMFSRLTSAHVRGDDAVALDGARRLTAFQKSVDARAAAMGFQLNGANPQGRPIPISYLHSIDQLPLFLADQERRAKEPPRGPIPPRGGNPSARVAALIQSLDQIHVTQMSVPGSADPGNGEAVHLLVQEGDTAVGPLLDAFVADTRLTRSMSLGRGGSVGHIHPVTDAIYRALIQLLRTDRFPNAGYSSTDRATPEGRKKLVAAMRAFWDKNRAVTLIERWYRDLRDDKAGPDRWKEAIGGITSVTESTWQPGLGRVIVTRTSKPGEKPAMAGEPLRSRRDPSVSELMTRRIADMTRDRPSTLPDYGLVGLCGLAMSFARWDEAAALPTVKALMDSLREKASGKDHNTSDHGYGATLAKMTLLRVQAGDRSALDDYASWVRRISPVAVDHSLAESLKPLWTYPDDPSIAAATRAMFTDPKSPWLPLVSRERERHYFTFEDPITSPLLALPWFRQAVLAALADKTEVGTAQRSEKGPISVRMDSGMSSSLGGPQRVVAPEDRPAIERRFRACDWVARKLSTLEGAPECEPYWPEAKRDAAVAASTEYVRRYGLRFSAEIPPGDGYVPHPKVQLRFPALGRPASAEDVREVRAIFSLDGEGETRVVALPTTFPLRARWTTLTAFPVEQQTSYAGEKSSHNMISHDYLRDGWVWQAEEVRKGDRWERFYGFVGHATIARVPATEIAFPSASYPTPMLSGGLEAQLVLPDVKRAPTLAGRPIVVVLVIRNSKGVEQPAPIEFLRPGVDGKPALRRGVAIVLKKFPKRFNNGGLFGIESAVEQTPTRESHFDPSNASRSLAPTESFNAMRINLADWFGPLSPGNYTCHLTFTTESGLGEGKTGDLYLTVGDPAP